MSAHCRVATNIDGLDLILDGGLRYPKDGSLFLVILGGPGTGKTNLALELTVRVLAGSEVSGCTHLYYSLDQPPAEVHEKLREDFDYYGIPGEWSGVAGAVRSRGYEAVVNTVQPGSGDRTDRYLMLASLRDPERRPLTGSAALFERIDQDIGLLERSAEGLGTPVQPSLVTIDSISLSSFDDGSGTRVALRNLRDSLAERRMKGIFVVETPQDGSDRATFAAAEYSADVIIALGYHVFGDQFKERSLEIAKARHQFYYRGTHHFSIVGQSGGNLRGARGQRRPGLHVYPSTPTLLSYLQYRSIGHRPLAEHENFGTPGVTVKTASSNGLVAPRRQVKVANALALRFLLAGEAGLLVSFQQSAEEILESIAPWIPAMDEEELAQRIHALSFQPEYLSSGKLMKDLYDELQALREEGRNVERAVLFGLGHLRWGFPLLHDARMLIPWLSVFFKRQSMTSLFVVESRHPGEHLEEAGSPLPDTVDNLFTVRSDPSGSAELHLSRALNARLPDASDRLPLKDLPP